ncbi:hypothetical protein [Saccharopolyspora aridisoli]|nr:hypothetical protein [Saccharopolyspora aridisoli]
MSTFLLVHVAWHSGRAWDRVVPLLRVHRVFTRPRPATATHATC